MIPSYLPPEELTKQILISDIASLYYVLGWCSTKILLQRRRKVAVKSLKLTFEKWLHGEASKTNSPRAHDNASSNISVFKFQTIDITLTGGLKRSINVMTTGQFLMGRPITHIIARPLQIPIGLAITLSHRCMESVSNTNSTLLASLVFRKLEHSSNGFPNGIHLYARSQNGTYCVR